MWIIRGTRAKRDRRLSGAKAGGIGSPEAKYAVYRRDPGPEEKYERGGPAGRRWCIVEVVEFASELPAFAAR